MFFLKKLSLVAGATNCTTKTLSVQLSLALKLIKNHFENYCNKISKLNGYCMHWSIDNSSECMSKIKNVNAHSVYTFDFSNLYTNLPLIDIPYSTEYTRRRENLNVQRGACIQV